MNSEPQVPNTNQLLQLQEFQSMTRRWYSSSSKDKRFAQAAKERWKVSTPQVMRLLRNFWETARITRLTTPKINWRFKKGPFQTWKIVFQSGDSDVADFPDAVHIWLNCWIPRVAFKCTFDSHPKKQVGISKSKVWYSWHHAPKTNKTCVPHSKSNKIR